MIIDIHAHYHPARFNEALRRLGYPGTFGGPVTDSTEHVQQRLEMMDAAGVGLQVLSPAAGHAPYGTDEAMAVEDLFFLLQLVGRRQAILHVEHVLTNHRHRRERSEVDRRASLLERA